MCGIKQRDKEIQAMFLLVLLFFGFGLFLIYDNKMLKIENNQMQQYISEHPLEIKNNIPVIKINENPGYDIKDYKEESNRCIDFINGEYFVRFNKTNKTYSCNDIHPYYLNYNLLQQKINGELKEEDVILRCVKDGCWFAGFPSPPTIEEERLWSDKYSVKWSP